MIDYRGPCDLPNCNQPAVVLLANDAPLLSPEYLERYVCRWHERNPFPAEGCAICGKPARHGGLCCAHRYDEQPACGRCA